VRWMIGMPLLVAVLAGVGYGASRAAGIDAHGRELLAAAIVAIVAAELAMVPLILSRGGSQLAQTQAGLVATAVHLLMSISLAAGVMLARLGMKQVMLFWLLPFYGVTLVGVVMACVKAVKEAPPVASGK